MTELPAGSGGLVYSTRMSALVTQAGSGVLSTFEGGQELRGLFREATGRFNRQLLNEFALMCYMGYLEGVKKAVESGKAPPLTGTETPLEFGYAILVVTGSQRVSVPSDNPNKPLHSETLKFLLENGCPPDTQDICRQTALERAIEIPASNADLARMLIVHGANVNHRNIYGMTPIFQAVMTAHSKAVDVLMEYGADLDATDADGATIRTVYMQCGPKVHSVLHAWERRRAGEQALLGEKGCALCGKGGKLLFCAACHSVRYCSSECQKKDWKEHKKSCKRFSGSNTITVRPHYGHGGLGDAPFTATAVVPMQQIARAISGLPSRFPKIETAPSNKPMEYPKKKIIKVQLPTIPGSSNGDIMVYDAKRELLCYISRGDAPAAYDRLRELIRSKGTFGLKAYLVAELKSKDELVIKIDEILAAQPF